MISFRSRLYRFFLTRQLRSQPPITDVAALRTGLDALSRRFKMPKGVIVETLDVGAVRHNGLGLKMRPQRRPFCICMGALMSQAP